MFEVSAHRRKEVLRTPSTREGGGSMNIVVLAVAVAGLTLGACGGSDPGSQPGDQSNEAGSSEEIASPTTPSSPAGDSASDPELVLSVTNGRFNPEPLRLAAGEPTKLLFVNNGSPPHNLWIYVSKGGKNLFKGKDVEGGDRAVYSIPPLKSGRYYFTCDIHPTMEGTLIVK